MPVNGTTATPATRNVFPGFEAPKTANGAPVPLADDKVYDSFIGRSNRPLRTDDKIDGWEIRNMAKMVSENPADFLSRLAADSMNGTPVDYQFSKEIRNLGVLNVDFHAENGEVTSTARLDVYNKVADKWLGAYLAKDARQPNTRSSVEMKMTAKVAPGGNMDDVNIELNVANLPRFDADRMLELEKDQKELKRILKSNGSQRAKQGELSALLEHAVTRAAEFPIFFLLDLIDDSHTLQMQFKEKDYPMTVDATAGQGNYEIKFKDILGERDGQANINATVAGTGDDSTNELSVDAVRVFNDSPWAVSFKDGQAEVSRKDPKTGKHTRIDDHASELLMYLPFVLAIAKNGNPF